MNRLRWLFLFGTGLLSPAALAVDSAPAAEPRLTAVTAAQSVSEAKITALYASGRLRQLQEDAAEPAEFSELLRDHADHPLAQLARVKLILRRLYALDGPSPADRLAAAEALGGELTLPALQCDFHLAMGDAYVFFGDQREAALKHFTAAERLGITSSATRGTVLVQIGELARLTGGRAQAAQAYRKFLDDFPRDIRQQIVRDRLAEVVGGMAP